MLRENNKCKVFARICPEHRVRTTPYEVFITVDEKKEKIVESRCLSCAACEGGCKHAVAFLMWVHRRSEEPARTSTVCYWKKAQLAKVDENMATVRAKDMGTRPKNSIVLPDNSDFLNSVKCEFLKRNKKEIIECTLSRQILPVSELRQLSIHQLLIKYCIETREMDAHGFISFASNCITSSQCAKMTEATIAQSLEKFWFEMRYVTLTIY